jgi:DtxR family manganese transport transcriptional regulator
MMVQHPAKTLEPEDTQAQGFGRARRARATELLEDYAELIDDLSGGQGQARATDIARRLGVSHVTAVKAIARLEREGLALSVPHRGVSLTDPGRALAARVRARHQLVFDLLLALGVPPDDARADAEGIEHHVSPATLAAFARFLNR